jgi:hypothetical protein
VSTSIFDYYLLFSFCDGDSHFIRQFLEKIDTLFATAAATAAAAIAAATASITVSDSPVEVNGKIDRGNLNTGNNYLLPNVAVQLITKQLRFGPVMFGTTSFRQ